jgi:hypothetical protein
MNDRQYIRDVVREELNNDRTIRAISSLVFGNQSNRLDGRIDSLHSRVDNMVNSLPTLVSDALKRTDVVNSAYLSIADSHLRKYEESVSKINEKHTKEVLEKIRTTDPARLQIAAIRSEYDQRIVALEEKLKRQERFSSNMSYFTIPLLAVATVSTAAYAWLKK